MASTLDENIDLFEQHFSKRYIGVAEELARQFKNNSGELSESGFFILSGIASYFETINQYLKGESSIGKSKLYFQEGFRAVYPNTQYTDNEIGNIYDWLRNGLYHSALPKHDTRISRHFTCGIEKDKAGLDINPAELIQEIRLHFDQYILRLKCPEEEVLRTNFEKMINHISKNTKVRLNRPPKVETTPNPHETFKQNPD